MSPTTRCWGYLSQVDTPFAIKVLRKELERLNHVIRMLESLAAGRPRRGRPPKYLAELRASSTEGKRKRRKAAAKR